MDVTHYPWRDGAFRLEGEIGCGVRVGVRVRVRWRVRGRARGRARGRVREREGKRGGFIYIYDYRFIG